MSAQTRTHFCCCCCLALSTEVRIVVRQGGRQGKKNGCKAKSVHIWAVAGAEERQSSFSVCFYSFFRSFLSQTVGPKRVLACQAERRGKRKGGKKSCTPKMYWPYFFFLRAGLEVASDLLIHKVPHIAEVTLLGGQLRSWRKWRCK